MCDRQTCLATVETTSAILEGCKCLERRSTSQETCCCPKPKVTEACLENGTLLVEKRISHKFNPEKGSCEAITQVVRRPVGTFDLKILLSLYQNPHY